MVFRFGCFKLFLIEIKIIFFLEFTSKTKIFFLSFVGFVMIYSATSGMEYNVLFSHTMKILVGMIAMLIIAVVDIEFWKIKFWH